jgi:hypothetical protein
MKFISEQNCFLDRKQHFFKFISQLLSPNSRVTAGSIYLWIWSGKNNRLKLRFTSSVHSHHNLQFTPSRLDNKTFYGRNLRLFVPGKPFHSSLMFVSKDSPNPSGAPEMTLTLGQAPGLTHKYQTKVERLACDKQSSLKRTFVNYRHIKFYNIWPWWPIL